MRIQKFTTYCKNFAKHLIVSTSSGREFFPAASRLTLHPGIVAISVAFSSRGSIPQKNLLHFTIISHFQLSEHHIQRHFSTMTGFAKFGKKQSKTGSKQGFFGKTNRKHKGPTNLDQAPIAKRVAKDELQPTEVAGQTISSNVATFVCK